MQFLVPRALHLSDFDYELPAHLIARHPLPRRTASRLMCLERQTGAIRHRRFPDLADMLRPGDLLVLNDTRVIPARLIARKPTGGRVEILVERLLDARRMLCQLGSNRTPRDGSELLCGDRARARILGREERFFLLEFDQDLPPLLEELGEMPLPPYLAREPGQEDRERYQTVYAERPGAVAAPTAGLHFDESLLLRIQDQGVELGRLTLHVGAGTFQPVAVDRVEEHRMHAELVAVDETLCGQVAATRERNGRVVAVGTTSMRALESAAVDGALHPLQGETRLYILPGYRFQVCDALVTNFHLPRSTLLMLVSAFAGIDPIRQAYREAVEEEYRFFSYGDAMFIHGGAP